MSKDLTKKRKQDLGIFYTPQEVVDFIFDILNIWRNREDKETHRWQTRKPRAHFPSVIDPACGEGVFLKTAVTSGFTGYHPTEKTPYVFGVDMDGDVVKRWEEISILNDLFKGNKEKMLNHFHQQDGLLELPDKVFNYKTGGLKEFDAVVGNPPYGGMGFSSLKEKSTAESIQILEHLKKYQVLSYRKMKNGNDNGQTPLWGGALWGTMPWGGGSRIPDTKEVESTPIEILFLDRFIQLAKPGGWISVIIPDGILTNSNSQHVREFISDKAKVEAIVSLPRETFKNAGTNAKTSILFLKKLKIDEKSKNTYPVFLASVEKINKINFDMVVNQYEKNYNSRESFMDKRDLVQITKDQTGKEVLMVRTDKTMKTMLEEKPFSRLDVNYWHPKWDKIIQELKSSNIDKKYLFEFFKDDGWLISTDHVRASKGEVEAPHLPIEYYSPAGLLFTGYKTSSIPKCSENAFKRMQRARPIKYDVLLGGFGMGPTGKSLVMSHNPSDKAIVGNIFILRVKDGYNPYVLDVFFKSRFGQAQFNKYKTGVAFNSLSNEEVKYIIVPEFIKNVIDSFHNRYQEIANVHDKAMFEDNNGNKKGYQDNIELAEKMLKELIKKMEGIIEGKREDVN